MFVKNFAWIAKSLTILTHHYAKFDWTPDHQVAFVTLRDALIQASVLNYPDPLKWCIVYTDASHNDCGAQLSQEHNGQKLPVAFLSHIFMDTQQKWSTPKQKANSVYYAITKWNYYLQGSATIMSNDHKLLQKFLNGKNMNKVNYVH